MATLAEMKQFLTDQKDTPEVKAYLADLSKPSLDGVKAFLVSDPEGKKYLQSERQTAVTAGIETFKKDTLPGIIQEEVKKQHPEVTPEQQRIAALEEKTRVAEAKAARAELVNKATALATAKKIPLEMVENLIGADEASTIANIDRIAGVYETHVNTLVEERFKTHGREPDQSKPQITDADLSTMDPTRRLEVINQQNPPK